MKIHAINLNSRIGFTSLRTDKKQVIELKDGEKPILDNKKYNIVSALNNMAENPERKSIEFLLDVAKNLQYGQNGDSEFRDIIDESTEASTERENTDWSKMLAETIERALNSSTEDVSDLRKEYSAIFDTKQPLTQEQKDILDLRKSFKKLITDESVLDDSEKLTRSASASKNIDYFISSSEISLSQKKACLEKFIYFLSDDYKINPQLEGKKIQIVDEMLNDMIIKTPDNPSLTTKTVDQLYTGMCAAISLCRKAVAYEDKVRYMEIVMDELSASPTMEIYDITTLDSEDLRKINIPKIYVDYNSALDKGYRILDASAHLWMNNAHASGNGTLQTEKYIAFDDDSYGIFDDSSWYEGMTPELAKDKTLLRNLIVENELLNSVLSTKKKIQKAAEEIRTAKQKAIETQTAVNGKFNEIFKEIFPDKTDAERTRFQNELIAFYKGTSDSNEINVAEKLSDEIKQQIIGEYILNHAGLSEQYTEVMKKKLPLINSLIEEYISADNNVKKLSRFNTNKGKYDYYKKLYKLAAAHRLAIEADINMDDGVYRFERLSGLPPRETQIIDYMQSLKGTKLPDGKTQEDLESDILKMDSIIPAGIDSVLKKILDMDVREICIYLLKDSIQKVKANDDKAVTVFGNTFSVGRDRNKIEKNLNNWVIKLEQSPSQNDIKEVVRLLGFEDRCQIAQVFINSFLSSLQEGISESHYNMLIERFGSAENLSEGLVLEREKILNLFSQYDEIVEKWNVPSARDLILQKMEKSNEIMTRRKLDVLKHRFDYITSAKSKNDKIENTKERNKANDRLFEFTNDEIDIFKQIESKIPQMKKYCKMEYSSLNKVLFGELEEQYASIGMLNGQFWVREEGSTGLSSNEQVRIIEQMTGKPYHIVNDIEDAAEEIKKGNGSGAVSYSVDDTQYAFHAMYVPSVTSETFTNPITGEKTVKDILWTDNSWGKSERQYYWNGRNGFNYTDYGQGYGLKDGFITSSDMKIGIPVKELKSAVGVNQKDKEKFGILLDMILPGMPVNAYQKLYKMFSYVLTITQSEVNYNALEKALKEGKRINTKFLTGLDDLAELRLNELNKKIETEIKSKEDFDKLPDDDKLKFAMTVLSLYLSTENIELADAALEARTMKDIEELKEDFLQGHVNEIGAIFAKTDETVDSIATASAKDIKKILEDMNSKFGVSFTEEEIYDIIDKIFYDEEEIKKNDGTLSGLEKYLLDQVSKIALETFKKENQARYFIEQVQKCILDNVDTTLRIKSLDSPVLQNCPLKDEIFAAVDKYLKPASDDELLALLQGLQNADYDTANKFFDVLLPEDVGLKYRDPYEYIVKIKTEDSSISTPFSEVVATSIISDELAIADVRQNAKKSSAKKKEEDNSEENEECTPSELFRDLYVKLSEMDVQKYIQSFKAEAFAKYKVRQAFPEPVIYPDDELANPVFQMFKIIEEIDTDILNNNRMIDIFNCYDAAMYTYKSTQWFNDLEKGRDISFNEETLEELIDFKSKLKALYNLTKSDDSLEMLNKPLSALIQNMSKSKNVNGREAAKSLKTIAAIFDEWDSANLNKQRYFEANKNSLSELRKSIKLLVDSNIQPQYRDRAIGQLENIASLRRKNATAEEIEQAENEYLGLAIEKHITKNPTQILTECVRLLQEGKEETQEYKNLRQYLIDALKVAQQTKIQYKLVKNAHEGISSKTKDLLPMFSVQLKDGTSAGMETETGMLYIIQQLENKCDDNKTLKLFLNQTGLSELALTAALNNFNISETYQIVDDKCDEIHKTMQELDELNGVINEFFGKNRILFPSCKIAVNQLAIFVKRRISSKDNDTVKKYLYYLKSIEFNDELKSLSTSMLEPVVRSLNEDVLNIIVGEVNSKIQYVEDIQGLLEDRCNLINIIDVPEDSDAAKSKEEFYEEYNKIQAHIQNKCSEIQDAISNLTYMMQL